MPSASPPARDPALEAHLFWYKYRGQILAAILIAFLIIVGFAGYRFYSERQEAAAAELLGSAKNAQGYEQVIVRYPHTNAGATAHLFLAETQRTDRKFADSNTTLQKLIDKYPKYELTPTARMAIAANLESMGKLDEALATYQRVAADYPKSFEAPVALISQIRILKSKNQDDAARRICETVLTQYRESIWAGEAMRELRTLKPSASAAPAGAPNAAPGMNAPPMLARPQPAAPTAVKGTSPAKPKP